MTPNTGAFDEQVISDAMAKVFERSGDGVLVTHSQGGGPGWWTAIKSDHVKGIIALEPGSGFIFPEGEVPAPMETSSPFGALKGTAVKLSDFEKLTKRPILVVYGDNIPTERTEAWNLDNWRVRLAWQSCGSTRSTITAARQRSFTCRKKASRATHTFS
mgnify:CR=1 FL=1